MTPEHMDNEQRERVFDSVKVHVFWDFRQNGKTLYEKIKALNYEINLMIETLKKIQITVTTVTTSAQLGILTIPDNVYLSVDPTFPEEKILIGVSGLITVTNLKLPFLVG